MLAFVLKEKNDENGRENKEEDTFKQLNGNHFFIDSADFHGNPVPCIRLGAVAAAAIRQPIRPKACAKGTQHAPISSISGKRFTASLSLQKRLPARK